MHPLIFFFSRSVGSSHIPLVRVGVQRSSQPHQPYGGAESHGEGGLDLLLSSLAAMATNTYSWAEGQTRIRTMFHSAG